MSIIRKPVLPNAQGDGYHFGNFHRILHQDFDTRVYLFLRDNTYNNNIRKGREEEEGKREERKEESKGKEEG